VERTGTTEYWEMRTIRAIVASASIVIAIAAPPRADASPSSVAALQAALTALHLYGGYVDGIRGPLTRRGVIAFQRRLGLTVDGLAGPQTRRALGWRGRPRLGSRVMRAGNRGWDVAALQFLLQRAGRGPGRADGLFGPLTRGAVRRAQRAAGIAVDGLAGPVTIASLRHAGEPPGDPVRFLQPVSGPIGDAFGVARSGGRRHEGLDFPVPHGTRVGAAGRGTTIYAGYNYGGYGNLVVIQHRLGFTSWYAHLSSITSWVGERVSGGTRIGYVGSTGYSTGPHLHFEVRRYDTPIDPLPRLLSSVATHLLRPGVRRGPRECGAVHDEIRRPPRGFDWIARERLCPAR
jgi:murein DD-endopeptidase MepM/ murein hydrolase activator NlpD